MYPDVILEVQDLRYLTWARIRNSSGTAGSYLKAYETIGGVKRYYKLASENEASAFDVMEDRPVQCFFGGRSASDNLKLIPREQKPVLRRLEERDGAFLFRNLEIVLPEIYRDKIWEMIWRRWQHYEDL